MRNSFKFSQKLLNTLIFILSCLISNSNKSLMSAYAQRNISSSHGPKELTNIIDLVTNLELANSESEITDYCIWPSSISGKENLKSSQIYFEMTNKTGSSVWMAILNEPNFFMPTEIPGAFISLHYSSKALIVNKDRPIYIYIWLKEPIKALRKSRVQSSDIIYKILGSSLKSIFLSWTKENKLMPQTGGGTLGIRNLVSANEQTRKSYFLQKEFSIYNNIKKQDLEELKNAEFENFFEIKKDNEIEKDNKEIEVSREEKNNLEENIINDFEFIEITEK